MLGDGGATWGAVRKDGVSADTRSALCQTSLSPAQLGRASAGTPGAWHATLRQGMVTVHVCPHPREWQPPVWCLRPEPSTFCLPRLSGFYGASALSLDQVQSVTAPHHAPVQAAIPSPLQGLPASSVLNLWSTCHAEARMSLLNAISFTLLLCTEPGMAVERLARTADEFRGSGASA